MTLALKPRFMKVRIRVWSSPSFINIHISRNGEIFFNSSRTSIGAASTNPFIRSALSLGS